MTTYDHRPNADRSTSAGFEGTSSTTDQAKQAAQTAADEGKHLADVAKSEARDVAADAKQQGAQLFHQARHEVEQQSRSQLDNLVTTLQGFADDLEKMARGDGSTSGLARDVVEQVGDKARAASAQLRDREPGELLDQARHYARQKPGTFLLGALAAGVVAGRLARGAKDASSGSSTPQAPTTGAVRQPAPPAPPAPAPDQSATATAAFPPAPPPTPGLTGSAPQPGTATGDPLRGTTGWSAP